jgi:drug/metabolite transporter (DMT)-like permease
MIASSIWLPATVLAGLLQAWRTALQQQLRATLSVNGAGLVRYLYGIPVAVLLLLAYVAVSGATIPPMTGPFFFFAVSAGAAQIVATNLLIMAFGFRNFVVGTAFSKTEAVQAAVFGWLVLGETVGPLVMAAVLIGVGGVLVLALGERRLPAREMARALVQPAALCGLGSGALFALTSVFVRGATGELGGPDPVAAALTTLVVVIVIQTVLLGAYVAIREPGTLRATLVTWRTSGQVGLLAALGSACWFTGFATAPVVLVRVVGQVEVLFTIGFAHLYLRERVRAYEVVGLLLVIVGVILALIGVSS